MTIEELVDAHYKMTGDRDQLCKLTAELLAACKALQMEARARNCGLRIADEAIAKAEKHGTEHI